MKNLLGTRWLINIDSEKVGDDVKKINQEIANVLKNYNCQAVIDIADNKKDYKLLFKK